MRSFNLYEKISKIKMFILDVDGILTQGGITYITNNNYARRFDVKDGLGLVLLTQYGYKTAIITGKKNEMAQNRADVLGICDVYQSFPHKTDALDTLLEKHNLKAEECAFIGDDLIDIEVIKRVGFGITVSDGHPAVKQVADYITRHPGGTNAVREICDLFISFQLGDFSCAVPIPDSLTTKWRVNNFK